MAFGLSAGAISAIGAVAGPVLGGMMGNNAASSAADAQARGAAEANATQRYMFDTTRADNAPFLNNGTAGNNRLAYLLGLNPSNGGGGNALSRDGFRNQLLPQFTTTTASQPALADGRGWNLDDWYQGIQNQGGSTSAVDEVGLKAEIERRMAEQAQQQASMQQQSSSDPAFGSLLRNFSMADRDADPVYQSGLQFGLDQGVQGINRMAAANGGADSGAVLKALTRFGNDYGSTKANDSFNRFNTNKQNTFNMLSGISGTGQVASNQVGAAGQNYANQVSANQTGLGNARGASMIGGANALSGGLTGAYNNYQSQNMFNRLMNRNDPYGTMDNYGGNSGVWNGGLGSVGWVSGSDLE